MDDRTKRELQSILYDLGITEIHDGADYSDGSPRLKIKIYSDISRINLIRTISHLYESDEINISISNTIADYQLEIIIQDPKIRTPLYGEKYQYDLEEKIKDELVVEEDELAVEEPESIEESEETVEETDDRKELSDAKIIPDHDRRENNKTIYKDLAEQTLLYLKENGPAYKRDIKSQIRENFKSPTGNEWKKTTWRTNMSGVYSWLEERDYIKTEGNGNQFLVKPNDIKNGLHELKPEKYDNDYDLNKALKDQRKVLENAAGDRQ